LLDGIDLHVVFHEMHRSIEEAASAAARDFMEGAPDLTYPPNHGFLPDELEALASLPRTAALEGALRKLIADAAAYPLFHLLSLADGIVDAPELDDVQPGERIAGEIMLHDGLYESYWSWRRRRPDPGWRLDTYEGE
jgi:hypothetical protein